MRATRLFDLIWGAGITLGFVLLFFGWWWPLGVVAIGVLLVVGAYYWRHRSVF